MSGTDYEYNKKNQSLYFLAAAAYIHRRQSTTMSQEQQLREIPYQKFQWQEGSEEDPNPEDPIPVVFIREDRLERRKGVLEARSWFRIMYYEPRNLPRSSSPDKMVKVIQIGLESNGYISKVGTRLRRCQLDYIIDHFLRHDTHIELVEMEGSEECLRPLIFSYGRNVPI